MQSLKNRIERWKQAAAILVVWNLLPRRVVMWCAIRVVADATTDEYSNQVVPELEAMEAIRRWDT